MPKVGIEAKMEGKAGVNVSPVQPIALLVMGEDCAPGDKFQINVFVDGRKVNISGELVIRKGMDLNLDLTSWTLEIMKMHTEVVAKEQDALKNSRES